MRTSPASPPALLVALNMLFAVGPAHRGELLASSELGDALELHAFYLLGPSAILLLGVGRLSVDGCRGRRR